MLTCVDYLSKDKYMHEKYKSLPLGIFGVVVLVTSEV